MVVPSIPYLLDPTRKVDTSAKFIMFDRSIIEMHHMSFVRRNIRFVSYIEFDRGVSVRNLNQIEDADVINAALVNVSRMKLSNVSNRANYTDVDEFVQRFEVWSGPEMGVIHPHPYIGRSFHEVCMSDSMSFGWLHLLNRTDCCSIAIDRCEWYPTCLASTLGECASIAYARTTTPPNDVHAARPCTIVVLSASESIGQRTSPSARRRHNSHAPVAVVLACSQYIPPSLKSMQHIICMPRMLGNKDRYGLLCTVKQSRRAHEEGRRKQYTMA